MRYRPGELHPRKILTAIRELGFEPRLEDPETASGTDSESELSCDPLPDPIGAALVLAHQEGKPLFLDFFAEWCAPCHTLEEEVLPAPAVKAALANFRFLRVDTDKSTQATQCLKASGLPTIVVLSADGAELLRHEGLLDADELASRLLDLIPGN